MPPQRNPIVRKPAKKKKVARKKPPKAAKPGTVSPSSGSSWGTSAETPPVTLYDWGDGKGKVHTRRKKERSRSTTPTARPGPYTDAERKKVERHKRKPSYGKALQKARQHGPRRAVGSWRAGEDKSDADRRRGLALTNRNIREIRKRVLTKRYAGSGTRQIKRELEGKGVLADVSEKLSAKAAPLAVKVIKARTGSQMSTAPGADKLLERGVKDLINLPAQAIPSVYVPAAGVVEAAQGRPERLKKFAKDIDESDPVYNLGAAAVEAVGGDTKSAKKRLDRAKKAAAEHPGFTAVEFAGLKGAAGRGTGKALRSGGKTVRTTGKATRSKKVERAGEKIRRAGSTERESARVEGTNLVVKRSHSPDAFKKAKTVMEEKARRKEVRKTRERADREAKAGNEEKATQLREHAAKRDPDRVSEKEIKRRVDERIQVNEDVRRRHRAEASGKARKVVKRAKREKGALSVVAQRIARADKDDLQAYVRELTAEFDGLSRSGKRANKQLRTQLQKVIDDPKADMGRLEAVAREYQEITAPQQKALADTGLLADEQAVKARLIPYATRNMGAKNDKALGLVVERKVSKAEREKRIAELQQIVDFASGSAKRQRESGRYAFGKANEVHMERAVADAKAEIARLKKGGSGELVPLSVEQIRAHMKKNGVAEPAFLTQAPNQRGAKNFNVRSERIVGIQPGKRTGEATRKGTFDADPETLVEGAAKSQGLVDATEGFRSMLREFGATKKGKDGKSRTRTFQNKKQADQAARDALYDDNGDPNPNAVPMRAVRINPFAGTKAQLEKLLDDVDNLSPEHENQIVESLTSAARGGEGSGPWTLVPEAAADRLVEHLSVQGGQGGVKTLQLANQAFRKTVLSTSTSWFAGNLIEGLGRAALARSGPRSYATGRKAMKRLREIDPKMYEEAVSRLTGGGHFSSADRSHIRRGAEQFAGTQMAPIANALGKFWRTPGPKQAAELWHSYTDFVFNSLNGRIETNIQTAMLGQALRRSPLMEQKTLKLGKAAINDAAKGLTKTENQVQFGRAVDDMYGKYGKFSPSMRKMIATYTPFAAWAVNAGYFVARTLPRDHPVATSVIAASVAATEEWRKEHGLDMFMEGAVPGFLQGSVPVGKSKLRVSRFTPFGAFGSPGETIAGQFNPLLGSPLAALQGLDWTGRELRVKGKDGKSRPANELERFAFGAKAFAEATIPGLSLGQRIKKEGPKALIPLKPVAPPKAKTATLRKKKAPTWAGSSGDATWVGDSSDANWVD